MIKYDAQSGFSAVELMISLFIAVAFIGAGYQLYSVIIKDGSEARLRARANDIAYENLRYYSPQVTDPCTAFTPSPAPTLPNPSGLSNATLTVTISCPYANPNPTSKISVTVLYGTPQKEVTHALFVNK
jgi:Tfp pilus assembly protein PilE